MKRLMLMRHAKSSWEQPGQADFDRPLNPRGERSARLIGTYLRQRGCEPDLILCSSACRTRETVAGLLEQLSRPPDVVYSDGLYLADPDAILDMISAVDDKFRRVLVVGHNPGIEELAIALIAEDPSGARPAVEAKFPTGALASYKLDIKRWRRAGPGRITDFQTPKNLV